MIAAHLGAPTPVLPATVRPGATAIAVRPRPPRPRGLLVEGTNPHYRAAVIHAPPSVRGSLPRGPLDDEARMQMLAALRTDFFANSSADSRASHLNTWTTLHVRWFGSDVPVLPLTLESLECVSAQFKAGGYRSFANYLATVKDHHLELAPWTDDLARLARRCTASTVRGIGPAKQCGELPIADIFALGLSNEPLCTGGPVCPSHWATLATFHLLRGAETACALASSLEVATCPLRETFSLPISKTDPQAIGCCRSWGCVCNGLLHRACPAHSALAILDELKKRFGRADGSLPPGLPLFPDAAGNWCSRAGFVASVAVIADRIAAPTVDSLGRTLLGEHVWRVGGSRHLASLDVPTPILMLLARWDTNVVLRYIADAPLSALTRIYLDRIRAASSDTLAAALALPAGRSLQSIPLPTASVLNSSSSCSSAPPAAAAGLPPLICAYTARGAAYHLRGVADSYTHAAARKSPCGYAYGARTFDACSAIPAGSSLCGQCSRWLARRNIPAPVAGGCGLELPSDSD